MRGLEGKRIVVTGGASGIGLATVRLVEAAGADAAILDRDADAAAAVGVPWVEADLADAAAWGDAVRRAAAELGGLDGLVNNAIAGIGGPAPLEEQDPQSFGATLAANGAGTMAASQVAADLIDGPGAIVNVASLQGMNASPLMYGYGAAKAAVVHLTKSLALELAPRGVRVNAVAPALTMTPAAKRGLTPERTEASISAIPLGYPAEPEDIGAIIAFLLSDLARFVTGQVVTADGGLSLTTARPHRGHIA